METGMQISACHSVLVIKYSLTEMLHANISIKIKTSFIGLFLIYNSLSSIQGILIMEGSINVSTKKNI